MTSFRFGQNWKRYSETVLDRNRIEIAKTSLEQLLGERDVAERTFLDIGCGTGLFSLAAVELGADRVVAIDIDAECVAVAEANAAKWLTSSSNVPTFQRMSVLDDEGLASLGDFDIVYAWGSLHHTGSMWTAIENAAARVSDDGLLVFAIYNRHVSSPVWKQIKFAYNVLPNFLATLMVWSLVPVIATAKFLATWKNPFRSRRGMDFLVDVVDWVGGYPYEYASPQEIEQFGSKLGFELVHSTRGQTPIACNEFVFQRGSRSEEVA